MAYKHGDWYCEPKNEEEAREIVARAVASGAVLYESVGSSSDKRQYKWSVFPLWGVNEGLTFATNVDLRHSVFADAQELTIEQVRERFPLPNRVDWSKAPHDAQFYSCGKFRKYKNGNGYQWYRGVWISADKDSLDQHKKQRDFELRPESVNKEWDGEGQPPIGSECEALHNGVWHRCEILKHKVNNSGIQEFACDFGFSIAWSEYFRPIRPERDKWIVKAAAIAQKNAALTHEQAIHAVGEIYDALKSGDLTAPV